MVRKFGNPTFAEPNAARRFSADLIEDSGLIEQSVGARGRLADLIVCARPAHFDAQAMPSMMEAALSETGRPVLICPPASEHGTFEHVLIAWDGSECAARTVALTLPLLKAAKRVTIVSVEEDGLVPTDDALADYFAWHGVEANEVRYPSGNASPAAILLDHAGTSSADMIVAGASLRGRLGRILFGSVSAEMIERSPIPILMAN